ncbi:MAG: hypothetical protein IJQ66_00390 [Clostridia bacterium]|nr:hypothetical protein [Clostridia bacterium]
MLNNNSKTRFNFIALIMSLLLLFTACVSLIGLAASNKTTSANAEKSDEISPDVNLYSVTAKVVDGGLRGGGSVCVSQTITAIITPSTVADKYVTWSLAWANDAPLKNTDISEYLEVTEESQGNLTATINCYKSFRNSRAILTCTTRQGNKTGSCEIVYDGVPSSMSVSVAEGVTQYDLGNMTVDMLFVGSSYPLTVALDNVFHDAGSSFHDYVVTVSGVGTVNCGTYSRSPRGAGWSSHSNVVNFADIASEFITTSVTGNTVHIQPSKSLYDYYESSSTHYVEGNGETTTYTNKLYCLNRDSDGNLPYFIITVRHRTYGFSTQYRFFIGEQVESVSTSKTTITF